MTALLDDMGQSHPASPALVLSNDATAAGLARAACRGVGTAVIDHRDYRDRESFETALIDRIDTAGADIVCLAGFMRILTEKFVGHYPGRILNIHPSLLPKYRGLHTHERALFAGEATHGCTVHLVTPALDDGPILGQARVPVKPGDTPETLAARVLDMEHRLYPAVLRRFAADNRDRLQLT
ncbi:MAG: phosphoribosylglycinamide formyltransferase [Rhodobacteraceae bacterium]|nr:phosphoribosylglycinamide formyltransferase [Paracoccaceae bacterium]